MLNNPIKTMQDSPVRPSLDYWELRRHPFQSDVIGMITIFAQQMWKKEYNVNRLKLHFVEAEFTSLQ